MKKILSIVISLMLVLFAVKDGFFVFAQETTATSSLDAFAASLVEMVRKQDEKINNEEHEEDNDNEMDFPITYYETENDTNQYNSEMSSSTFTMSQQYNSNIAQAKKFSTGRLIVKSKEKIDTQGAIDYISGYRDLYILQYDTYISAQKAYEYYQTLDCVEYVEVDVNCVMQDDVIVDLPNIPPEIVGGNVTGDALSWVSEEIGFESIKEELRDRILKDVTVAILDSGVDTDHEFLEGRLLPNDVNLSSSGDANSCEDDFGHGTHVAGILADNTLENVKIKPYKVLNNMGKGSISLIAIAVDMAVEDGADIINMSLSAEGENQTLTDSVNAATEKGVNVIVAAGNAGADLSRKIYSPACIESAVTVSAIDKSQCLSSYSNFNGPIDIAAPGDNVKSCYLNNTYSLMSGTSMATPQVAAGFAIVRSVFPKKSAVEVEKMIGEYAIKIAETDGKNKFGVGILYLKYILQTLPRTASVEFSVPSGNFNGAFSLSLSCPETDATILYVVSNNGEEITDIDFTNGIQYKTPITISQTSKVTAVALVKGKMFSVPETREYTRNILTEDDKYDINSLGYITHYGGTDIDITIPQTVRGITVKGIGANAFKNNKNVRSVNLPDTATIIGNYAFYGCSNLEAITGTGLTEIGESAFQISTIQDIPFSQLGKIGKNAFSGCNNLQNVDLSNVTSIGLGAFENAQGLGEIELKNAQTIGSFAFRNSDITNVNAPKVLLLSEGAFAECRLLEKFKSESAVNVYKSVFENCSALITVELPAATTLNNDVFYGSSIRYVELPEVTKLGNSVFSGCESLRIVSLPKTTKIGTNTFYNCKKLRVANMPLLDSLNYNVFSGCESLKSLWLPNVKTIGSNVFLNTNVEYLQLDTVQTIGDLPDNLKGLVLPSALKSISAVTPSTNFIVYGYEGSYAQQYATSVNKEFKTVPCVIFGMPDRVNVEDRFIHAYAFGYNCTYQWYKNDTVSNVGGTLIENATNFFYEPSREDGAVSYYCIITSNDGINENIIVTDAVENAFEYQEGDYTEYNEVLKTVNSLDRTMYTEKSLALLDSIVNEDVSGLSLAEQSLIDDQVFAIRKAIEMLEYAFVTGDINADGNISLIDARMVLQAVAKAITLNKTQNLAADFNGDGSISLVDARMALQAVNQK